MAAKFGHSASGAAAVEFALVAAPLALVVFAIIEVSLMLATQYQLQSATDAMSRLIRSGQVSARDGSLLIGEAQFRDDFCSRISLIRNCRDSINIDLRNAPRFADLAREMPDPLAVGPRQSGETYQSRYTPGGTTMPGALIVTYDWNFIGPLDVFGNLAGMPGVRRLPALAVFMNEAFE